jgi:hypothetical protein
MRDERRVVCGEPSGVGAEGAADAFNRGSSNSIGESLLTADCSRPVHPSSLRPHPLREGEDYYREGAALVFTARYHLRRGYCCGSGCRHCPYEAAACEEKEARDAAESRE